MIAAAMASQWLAVEAGADLLARARQLQESWESLLPGGALDSELPPEATTGVRPVVVESWRRALATGLDPTDLLPSIEADPYETRERWLEHPLGSLTHVLVAQLHRLVRESESLVQVTDPSGLTLHLDGVEWLKERAAEMNLVEGARCSETVNGTNGVGTALAVNQPVQVFAFEHFSHHHREWVCSGAPIHDPVSGRLVGVINLSSPWKIAHPRSLELVTTAARTMEQCLLESRRDQDARLRRRYGDLTRKGTDLLVNRDGYVLVGDTSSHAKPFDVPESGGEIAMDDGSLAVAEPLGHGEAYLVRRIGPSGVAATPTKTPARPHEDADEEASGSPRTANVESGRPSAEPGRRAAGAYLEAALDCVIMADASGRVVEFNPAAERTFGYSRDEALGRTLVELIVPPSLRERHSTAFARFVETGHGTVLGQRLELTGMRADGSEFPVELALSQVEAEPFLICGALRDISAAKQAERHLRELADEQAALRRVATLVARESSPQQLFALVAEQVARILNVPLVRVLRYEPDGSAVEFVGGWGESADPLALGTRWHVDGPGVLASVWRSSLPARVDDYTDLRGEAATVVREAGMRSAVASPITVEDRLWGAIAVLSPRREPLPENTEARLADFTELVATAIANADSRAAIARLADEQAALRRVATLVARDVRPADIFSAVSEEVQRLFGLDDETLDVATVVRFDAGPEFILVGAAKSIEGLPLGTRWGPNDLYVSTRVHRTGRSARVDETDLVAAGGPDAETLRRQGLISQVASPIIVEGRLWGAITVNTRATLPSDPEERLERFTDLVATAIANTESRTELAASEEHARTLAGEQAALRRVATLVARESLPEELFAVVAEEVGRVVNAPLVAVARYEPDGPAIQLVGAWSEGALPVPIGGRWLLDGPSTFASVWQTGKPARTGDSTDLPGEIAAARRQAGLSSSVASPILVGGRLWGVISVASSEPFPEDTDVRLLDFTELVATAISNTEARDGERRLAEEQAALRRVAELVAREASQVEVFAAVADALSRLLGEEVRMVRYEANDAVVVAGSVGPLEHVFPVGSRVPLGGNNAVSRVFRTGKQVRIDDYQGTTGPIADTVRPTGLRSVVATPIVVESRLWGTMIVAAFRDEPIAPQTESRVAQFTELVATALANAESRAELAASEARARKLAEEQAALRRVATMVAEGATAEDVHLSVAREVAHVFGVNLVTVCRYESDAVVVLASLGAPQFPGGSSWPLDVPSLPATILETGRPARIDDYSTAVGLDAIARDGGVRTSVGAPIVVDGTVWGSVTVATPEEEPFPVDAEGRLAGFTDLVATAIANAESREGLRRLAGEQAALGRVATLVAKGATGDVLFAAVAREVAGLFGVGMVSIDRYENGESIVLASLGVPEFPVGSRWPLDGPGVRTLVYETGRPARVDDFSEVAGTAPAAARTHGIQSAIGVPIVVDGKVWGVLGIGSRQGETLPSDVEQHLAAFTELVSTAIANSDARDHVSRLLDEQSALRRVATLVAEGASAEELFSGVAQEVAGVIGIPVVGVHRYEPDATFTTLGVYGATTFTVGSRWPVEDEGLAGMILAGGHPARKDDYATMRGPVGAAVRDDRMASMVGVPIVVDGSIWGFMVAGGGPDEAIPVGTEEHLARFTELIATAVSNTAMRAELAASRARVIAAADEARRQIERDLHDGAQQQLVTLALGLRSAERRVPVGLEDIKADVGRFADRLTNVVEELREMSRGIHPAVLTEGGLSSAIEALALRSPVPVKLNVRSEHRLPEGIEVAVYYVVSEALTNAAKHADASRVQIDLQFEGEDLCLSVVDDGVGGADLRGGSGLIGLKDRVEALGGTIDVVSPPGSGTRLDVEIPLLADPSVASISPSPRNF